MADAPQQLKRELGVFGATLLGLGSILGTGVFVSLGIAAGIAGPAVLIAIVLAGFVALCNAMSSAQLAAAHPVAGGTYEYGYKFLHPAAGFTAGWMFMVAKSASAATAALGLVAYLMSGFIGAHDKSTASLQLDGSSVPAISYSSTDLVLAVFLVVALAGVVLSGIRRSSLVNTAIVGVTVASLFLFVFESRTSIAKWLEPGLIGRWAISPAFWSDLAMSTALMFVAYTGYGRIATLSEEVRQPRRTIPIAIISTLGVSVLLYFFVGLAAISFDPMGFAADDVEPRHYLLFLSQQNLLPQVAIVLSIGAITAMGGVLLNLILGLSRVLLAMGRRRDVPHGLSKLNAKGTTPTAAVIVVGLIIGGLVLIGDVKATWSLSAFTVLIYYGITNAAALRLPPENRLYPRAFSWIGLVACGSLALCVDARSIAIGGSILLAGFVWFAAARALRSQQ